MERLPGFRDFYPEPLPPSEIWSAEVRQKIFDAWRAVARRYGFREYDGPPLEPLELYTTKSGEEIVRQLYNFTDKGDRSVALRPEMTPTLARMAAARERGYRKPLKWFAIPQLFRYEKQQKGRLREHFQFNADILGETDSALKNTLPVDNGWLELKTGSSHSMKDAVSPTAPYIKGWWDGKGYFHPRPLKIFGLK